MGSAVRKYVVICQPFNYYQVPSGGLVFSSLGILAKTRNPDIIIANTVCTLG
jgi:hypothetical protein